MKKIILIIAIIIVIILGIFIFRNNDEILQPEEKEVGFLDNFVNSVMHRSDYKSGLYSGVYVFLENGEYYYFYQQYDAMLRNKAYKGTWTIENEQIKAEVTKKVYLEGGEITTTKEGDNYITDTKIINGELKLQDFETTFLFDVEKKQGEKGSKYANYLMIKDIIYYPIYEFETEDKVKEKLKEMYGEIFTLLEQ